MMPPLTPFTARPPWLNGSLQTFRAFLWPFPARLPPGHRLWLPLPDGDALAAVLHLPGGDGVLRPLAVLVHGMTGTEDDPCLREAAAGLLRRGFPVLRLNLRGNARSLPRSTSHYHLGRADDLADAIATLPDGLTGHGVLLAGWSLGGALVLNLLGGTRAAALPLLAGAAIGAPLQPELAAAAIDGSLVAGRALLALYRREVLAVAAADLPEPLRQAARSAGSLAEFERTVTVPRFGYPSHAVYCEMNRPAAALPRIRVPTLLLMAADDPLVPIDCMAEIDWTECPAVLPVAVAGGGHCGFYDRAPESLAVRTLCGFFEGAASDGPALRSPAVASVP